MAGRIVTHEQTGAKGWFDYDTGAVTPLQPDQVQRLEGINKASFIADQMKAMSGPDVMRQAKEKSAQEAGAFNSSMIQNVGVPLGQAALAVGTGGMSIPAQIAINTGTEYALQQAGVNPESKTQLALSALGPGISKGAEKVIKGTGKALANVSGKGQMAGEQAAAKVLDVPAEVIERSRYAPSKTAYKMVEGQGMIDTTPALNAAKAALQQELSLGSQANKQSVKYLQGIVDDLSAPAGVTDVADAKALTARAQRLAKMGEQAEKRGFSSIASTLKDATGPVKAGIPGLKEADTLYTRERVVDDIFKALRKGNKLKALDDLIAEQGGKMSSVVSDKDLKALRKIAATIVDMGGSGDAGIVKTGYEGILKSFLTDPNGLTVFRHAFGDDLGKLTKAGVYGLLPFIRGYAAQTQRKD